MNAPFAGDRRIYGDVVQYPGGSATPLSLAFLRALATGKCGPGNFAVRELGTYERLTVTVAGGDQVTLPQAYSAAAEAIYFADNDGERVSLREGGGATAVMASAVGRGAFVPSFNMPLAAGAGQTIEVYRPWYSEMPTIGSPKESRIFVRDLVDGTMIYTGTAAQIGTTANNRYTITGGTIQPYAVVIDEGGDPATAASKTRYHWKTVLIQESQKTYEVGANSRLLYWDQYLGTVAHLASPVVQWAPQQISSESLGMTQIEAFFLATDYLRRHSVWTPGTAQMFDPVMQGVVIPIYRAMERQDIPELPLLGAVQWQSSLTFPSGTFVAANRPCHIFCFVDPNPGCVGTNDAGAAVKTKAGILLPAADIDSAKKDYLPIVASGGKVSSR